ncbi:MAG TPA: hypothetical protein VM364_22745 [Vicinamibacterales bacterium]|nr:hypothetical protein [Vicinamibacterales bacterium]
MHRSTGRIVAAAACLAAAVVTQVARDRAYPREAPATQAMLYVRSPEAVKRMVLGFDALAADIYWIRAIQHFGGQRLAEPGQPRSYHLLYPLLDLTTALDPYFNIAYRFGAIFLSEPYPGGPGRPDLAVALLRRGIAVQPGKWQYYHDIGFVHYWSLDDPTTAAAWFQRAAEQPEAPNWLMPLAAAMLTQGADRVSARYLWQQIRSSAEEWLRRSADRALMQLDALDQIDALNAIVASMPPPAGHGYSWLPLVRAGRLRGIPLDPSGTPYEMDPSTGRVRVSERSPLFPLPAGVHGR